MSTEPQSVGIKTADLDAKVAFLAARETR